MANQETRRQFLKRAGAVALVLGGNALITMLGGEPLKAAGNSVKDRLQTVPDGGFIMADSQNPQNSIVNRFAPREERLKVATELAQTVNDGDGTYQAWGRVWRRENTSVASGLGVQGSFDYFRITQIAQPQISKDNVLGYVVTTTDGKQMPLSARDLLIARPGQISEAQLRANLPQLPENIMEVMPQIYQTLRPMH